MLELIDLAGQVCFLVITTNASIPNGQLPLVQVIRDLIRAMISSSANGDNVMADTQAFVFP